MDKKILLGVIPVMLSVMLLLTASPAMAAPSDKAFEKSGNFVDLFDAVFHVELPGWYLVGVNNPQSPGDHWSGTGTGMVSFDTELYWSPYTVMQVYTPTGEIIRNENFMGP